MSLTPQHLGEIVNVLSSSAEGTGQEHRRAARKDVKGNVDVTPMGADGAAGQSFTAIIRDISAVGIGLLQNRKMTAGQEIIVRLPRGEKPALFVRCTVMHVRAQADGLFLVGAEFKGAPNVSENELLVSAGLRCSISAKSSPPASDPSS